jgi:hypothetical protein
MIRDLVWSDPNDNVADFADNNRGSGVLFGAAAVKEFLTAVGLKAMVRAHQCVADGWLMFAQNCGITVFSSSEYCGLQHNRAGAIKLTAAGKIELMTLPAEANGEMRTVLMGFGKGIGLKRIFITNPAVANLPGMPGTPREVTPTTMAPVVRAKMGERFGGKRAAVVAPKCVKTPRQSLTKLPEIDAPENREPQATCDA